MSLKPSPSIPYLADGVISPVAQARTLKSSFLLLPPWVSHPRSHHILSKLHPRYPASSSQTVTKAPIVHVLSHFWHILSVLARCLLLKRAPTTYLLTFLMFLFHENTWSKNHLPLMCLDSEDTETDRSYPRRLTVQQGDRSRSAMHTTAEGPVTFGRGSNRGRREGHNNKSFLSRC